jgi:hypothetical protein
MKYREAPARRRIIPVLQCAVAANAWLFNCDARRVAGITRASTACERTIARLRVARLTNKYA